MGREGDRGRAADRGHAFIKRLMAYRVKEQILATGKPIKTGLEKS